MRPFKPWEAKPYRTETRVRERPSIVITDRTVVLHLDDTERWHVEHHPWIRQQRLALINYTMMCRDPTGYGGYIAATFRTKEHAALFKLFWFE